LPEELDIQLKGSVGYPDQGNVITISILQALYGKYYNSEKPKVTYIIRNAHTDKLDLLIVK